MRNRNKWTLSYFAAISSHENKHKMYVKLTLRPGECVIGTYAPNLVRKYVVMCCLLWALSGYRAEVSKTCFTVPKG